MSRSQKTSTVKLDALVIDDDASFRRDICECLEESGLTVAGAANGGDAMQYLRSRRIRPRVILLDLTMPEVNGFEFRAWLESSPSLSTVPVVLVSGNSEVREIAKRLGVARGLEKPISPKQLLDCIQAVAS